jgi:hypothetical protein
MTTRVNRFLKNTFKSSFIGKRKKPDVITNNGTEVRNKEFRIPTQKGESPGKTVLSAPI